MKSRSLFLILIAMCALPAILPTVKSQSPQPIVVQAATNAPGTSTAVAPAAEPGGPSSPSPEAFIVAMRTLEQIKTANEEVLKRQQATLQQLDELQQAAEELKVFSKRG